MSSAGKFVANRIGLGIMIHNKEIRELVDKKANAVADVARSTAPVDTGALKASIRVEDDTTDRPVARIVVDVPYGHVVAARTGFLARALDAARRA